MENPRKLALASLVKSEDGLSYSNIEVNTVISRHDMTKVDIALYTALYLGVVERAITLDYIISQYSSLPLTEIDTETKNALRMGIYQLLYMDKIPDYSAVSESVSLCKRRSKGYVNAVLRSFLRANKEYTLPQDKWQALSVELSIPEGIINILRSSYGDSEACEIAHALSSRREGTVIRINTLKLSPTEIRHSFKTKNIPYASIGFADECLRVKAPISDLVQYIDKGKCFVQDSSSFACVKILSPKARERVLDACACPGGKTFSCAIDMKNEGKIVACDLHKNKLSLVKAGAKKLGIDIAEEQEQDAKKYREDFDSAFDKVLCDVPCSGLGIISKKPDIRYKSLDQIENLPSVQLEILNNCSKYVKVGGELVYSTCTLNKKENEDVVKAFLASNSAYEALDFDLGDIKSEEGCYTFFPNKLECDGFFVAKLKRVR